MEKINKYKQFKEGEDRDFFFVRKDIFESLYMQATIDSQIIETLRAGICAEEYGTDVAVVRESNQRTAALVFFSSKSRQEMMEIALNLTQYVMADETGLKLCEVGTTAEIKTTCDVRGFFPEQKWTL